MKKSIITTFLLIFANLLFANEYEIKKVQEYNNDKNLISIRPSEKVAPQDDETGNRLFINDNGDFFIYNWDKLTTFKLADKTHLPEKEYKYDLSDLPCLYGLHRVSSDYLYYSWTYTSYLAVNIKTGKRKFQVSINDIFWDDFVYYDESTDILFFHDKYDNLHSIVHPGMNDAENRKNYKNPDQTLELFSSGYDMKNLGLYKGKYLTLNGDVYYWAGTTINHINYQIYDNKEVNIWNDDELEINCTSPDEEIESIAIHPSGDIYILRINWQTNKHTLYCIENSWDPQWHEQWYKEHSIK